MTWEPINGSWLIESLGWTLVHSLWQIAFVAAGLFFLLRILQGRHANLRYLAATGALTLSLILPAATFVKISQTSSVDSEFDSSVGINRQHSDKDALVSKDQADFVKSTGQAADQRETQTQAFVAGLLQIIGARLQVILPAAVGIWLLGVAFFSIRLTGGIWRLHKFKNQQILEIEPEWHRRFESLCERLGISRPVKLLCSGLVETPIAFGLFKPLIIVPASLFLQVSPHELETIIAHELIHIRRYDALVNAIQSFIEVLFFYHPCIWWISGEIRREREFAADAAVMHIFEDSHVVYARALANLEEIRLMASRQTPQIENAANGGNLMERIQRILKKNTEIKHANFAWSAVLAFVLISALLLVVFSLDSPVFVNAQSTTRNRKLAIGFVSIPPLDRTANPPKDSVATAKILIGTLKAHKVPAIGFVQGSMISDGEKMFPVRTEIVKMWRDEGFDIGIGNFKHIWFYNTPYDEYISGVEKNEALVRNILAEKNLPLRYFSYPYLNTGKSVAERDRFESWLKDRGLTSVKYTIDNNEWMYSVVYDMARNDNDLNTMTEIRIEFIKYMDKMFDHYEAYSQEMFGRDIPQTMVLTPSRLVADSADELFGMIEKRGYSFVPMSDALADEAYKTPESFVGDSGISWFERWTLAKGKRLRNEPKVDENVQKIWEVKKSKK